MPRNTRVEYLYRDGSNYKFRGSFVVEGLHARADIAEFLFDDGYFFPELVGAPSLTPEDRNEDDHDLHEIEEMIETEDAAEIAAQQFLDGLRRGEDGHTLELFETKPYLSGWR